MHKILGIVACLLWGCHPADPPLSDGDAPQDRLVRQFPELAAFCGPNGGIWAPAAPQKRARVWVAVAPSKNMQPTTRTSGDHHCPPPRANPPTCACLPANTSRVYDYALHNGLSVSKLCQTKQPTTDGLVPTNQYETFAYSLGLVSK